MRIVITGNGGSGKTWLGTRLAERLSLSFISLDDVYWSGAYGGTGRDKQEVSAEVQRLAATDDWVIEGVYGWLLPAALPRATEFVFVDLPVEECLNNLRSRGNQGGASEESFQSMLDWVIAYPIRTNANSRLAHRQLWDRFEGSKQRLTDRRAVDDYLALRTER